MARPIEVRYLIKFHAKRGCEDVVVRDMLRYDSQFLVNWERVEDGTGFAWIEVVAVYNRGMAPTMGRWASFAVGAQIVSEKEIF